MKSSRGFTLIELLIVIAIIGILMALLFPAVQTALDAAKKAQAKNDVTQLATAITAYEVEYGRLPGTNSGAADVESGLMDALIGRTNATTPNPRAIVFFEAKNAKNKKAGYESGGKFYDPWGGAYKIVFDTDYDNTLDVPAGENISGANIRKKVAIYNTNAKPRLRVASWE